MDVADPAALSACCVGVLCLMSSRMQLNKPAATAYSIYNISSDGRTSSATMAGVAIAQKENITVSSPRKRAGGTDQYVLFLL